MSIEQQRRNAISRALAHGGAAAVTRVRFGLYRVASASRPGAAHTVSVDARGAYRCSCEAGLAGRPACWHRAAVFVAKLEHAMRGKGRVTSPAAPSAPAPVLAPVIDLRSRRAA
jgi:SWIM zinc finger